MELRVIPILKTKTSTLKALLRRGIGPVIGFATFSVKES